MRKVIYEEYNNNNYVHVEHNWRNVFFLSLQDSNIPKSLCLDVDYIYIDKAKQGIGGKNGVHLLVSQDMPVGTLLLEHHSWRCCLVKK
jgi:hypothetical protein